MKRLTLAASIIATALAGTPTKAESFSPNFSLPAVNGGGNVSFPSGGVVIVDFWASWCGPCKASFSFYNRLIGQYSVTVIGVNEDKVPAEAQKFLKNTPASFSLAADASGSVYKQYGVGSMPTAFIFKDGALKKTIYGFNESEITNTVKELVK